MSLYVHRNQMVIRDRERGGGGGCGARFIKMIP